MGVVVVGVVVEKVVVVLVVGVVGVSVANSSSPSDVTASFGMRSNSYPVVTVPPCVGVCPSL